MGMWMGELMFVFTTHAALQKGYDTHRDMHTCAIYITYVYVIYIAHPSYIHTICAMNCALVLHLTANYFEFLQKAMLH